MTISFSERQPTALQQLSRSLGQGIGGGLQARNALNLENEKMSIADRLKTAQKQSELAQKQERFGEFSKTKEFKALDPLTQQVVEGEFLGIIPAGTGKSIIEIQQRQKEQDLLNSLLGGGQVNAQHQPLENAHENPLQQNAPSPNAPPTPNVPTESQLEQLTDNQLDQLIGMGGKIADVAKGVQTRKAEEKKSAERTKLALNKETLPVRKEISDRAENARRSIAQKENLIKTIDTGKIDDPTFAIVMESLPLNFGKRFLSPETVEYKSGLVQGYGDLKNIFTGATRVKEVEILENKIADLYLTDQQKKAILKSTMDINKLDLINEEVAAEIEAEGKNLGLLQFRKEVEKRAKPKTDAIFNKILDENQAIIKDAENSKRIPLSYDDPDDRQILEQLMQEAKSDRTKAREIAKKKGYTIGK